MHRLLAHCYLGTLYRQTGGGAKAREHLAIAATMHCEMDMGFWLEKTEAEMREPA
jgi:hypothetical protein